MRHSLINTLLTTLLTVLTCISIAYGIFGAGLCLCTTPEATKSIGSTFSNWDRGVFPEEDMAKIAEGVREFSIEGAPSEELFATVNDAIAKSYPELSQVLSAGEVSTDQRNELQTLLGTSSLSALTERYSFAQDALSHLQDCTPIFINGKISVGVFAIIGIVGLVALGVLRGRKRIGATLMLSSLLAFALLASLILWAVIDFDGLFTAMHSLLFSKGSWLFDSKSLLIQLFPEAFWAAMAALWGLTSVILSLIVFFLGKLIKR